MSTKRRKTCTQRSAEEEEFTVETRDALPAHFVTKIKPFSELWKRGTLKYESEEFEAGGCKWRLIIYPDGDETENKGDHISVYLFMVETSPLPEVNAMFKIFLFNQILDNYLCFQVIDTWLGKEWRRFHAMNPKWGFSKLISKKMLAEPSNGYIVDDSCVFGAEVCVIKSQPVIDCVSILDTDPYKHEFMISQFSKLQDLWSSEEFCAGDQRWKMMLYPNGDASGKGRSVSMYLECVGAKSFAPHKKVKADFCLRVKNKTYETHHSRNYSCWFESSQSLYSWGSSHFMSIADMRDSRKGFLVDDCCFLEVEFYGKVITRSESKME